MPPNMTLVWGLGPAPATVSFHDFHECQGCCCVFANHAVLLQFVMCLFVLCVLLWFVILIPTHVKAIRRPREHEEKQRRLCCSASLRSIRSIFKLRISKFGVWVKQILKQRRWAFLAHRLLLSAVISEF